MKSIDIFLQQNSLKNKTPFEQKKFLRKFLIGHRQEQYKLLGNTKIWGAEQFLKALTKLNISYPAELQNKFQVACFFPIRAELNLLAFAQPDWLKPKVNGDKLKWFEYGDGKTDYTLNKWNIPEKSEKNSFDYVPSHKPLVCFVPGLAGDLKGHRLGYGRGYYDRFLSENADVISILCLPSEEFFFDYLPHELHDTQVRFVVY